MITSSIIISKIKSDIYYCSSKKAIYGGGSRTSGRSKIKLFVTIDNSWKPLTLSRHKKPILNVAAVLDLPLSAND